MNKMSEEDIRTLFKAFPKTSLPPGLELRVELARFIMSFELSGLVYEFGKSTLFAPWFRTPVTKCFMDGERWPYHQD